MANKHGRHVKILGRGTPESMRSAGAVRALLEDLVVRLGMRCLDKPVTYEVEERLEKLGLEPFEDEGGVTGIVVLSTSHCSIHTWPLRGYFVMDVYSCRDFDPAGVEETLVAHFEARSMKVTDLSHSLIPDHETAPCGPVVSPARARVTRA